MKKLFLAVLSFLLLFSCKQPTVENVSQESKENFISLLGDSFYPFYIPGYDDNKYEKGEGSQFCIYKDFLVIYCGELTNTNKEFVVYKLSNPSAITIVNETSSDGDYIKKCTFDLTFLYHLGCSFKSYNFYSPKYSFDINTGVYNIEPTYKVDSKTTVEIALYYKNSQIGHFNKMSVDMVSNAPFTIKHNSHSPSGPSSVNVKFYKLIDKNWIVNPEHISNDGSIKSPIYVYEYINTTWADDGNANTTAVKYPIMEVYMPYWNETENDSRELFGDGVEFVRFWNKERTEYFTLGYDLSTWCHDDSVMKDDTDLSIFYSNLYTYYGAFVGCREDYCPSKPINNEQDVNATMCVFALDDSYVTLKVGHFHNNTDSDGTKFTVNSNFTNIDSKDIVFATFKEDLVNPDFIFKLIKKIDPKTKQYIEY